MGEHITAGDPVKLLLPTSGCKAYLVDLLERAGRARVVAADNDPDSTISRVARTFARVPPVRDGDAYLAALRELVARHEIDAIVPLNDIDLQLLADHAHELGARVLGAPLAVVDVVTDKLRMPGWLASHGLVAPETWLVADRSAPAFPVVVKARAGQGSAGLLHCAGADEYGAAPRAAIAQPRLDGPEYNLDVLRSASGRIVSVVPKRKLSMRHGSTDKARSVEAPELIELGMALGRAVGHLGSIDVDLIVTAQGPVILDINPRLGGGFPFTAHYCPEYVQALVTIAGGGEPPDLIGSYERGKTVYSGTHYFVVE